MHPFDVGDALLLGHSTTGNSQLVWVEEIALVNCVVRRWDGARIWWPNVLLDTYPLINLSRSNNKWESVEVGPLAVRGWACIYVCSRDCFHMLDSMSTCRPHPLPRLRLLHVLPRVADHATPMTL